MEKSSKEQKGKKLKQLHIRLSEEELDFIRKQAQKYPSMSSYILDAVQNHDLRRGRNRIDTMIKFSELMGKTDASLSRIGNNINQIAHTINRQMMIGLGAYSSGNPQFLASVEEAKALLKALILELRKISHSRT